MLLHVLQRRESCAYMINGCNEQGVTILIRREDCVRTSWEPEGSMIIKKTTLILRGHKITLFCVYEVNDVASFAMKDQSYKQLNGEASNVGVTKEAMLSRDSNGRVWQHRGCKVIGSFGENVVHDNGSRIIEICNYELKVLHGFLPALGPSVNIPGCGMPEG